MKEQIIPWHKRMLNFLKGDWWIILKIGQEYKDGPQFIEDGHCVVNLFRREVRYDGFGKWDLEDHVWHLNYRGHDNIEPIIKTK